MAEDQISVALSADISGLQAALQQAAAQFQQFFAAEQQIAQSSAKLWSEMFQTHADVAKKTMGDIKANNATNAAAVAQAWQQAFRPVESAFNGLIRGMISGHETFRQAASRAIIQWADQEIAQASSVLFRKLALYAADATGFSVAETEKQAAQETTGLIGLAGLVEKALKAIATYAAETFGGVFAFLAPAMGPAAAGPAAASSAVVAATAGTVVSAAGGAWSIPQDMLSIVHAQESILPANIAGPMRDFFTGGNGGSSSGGDSYVININAIDTQTGAQFLRNNIGTIVAQLANQRRNLNPAFSA